MILERPPLLLAGPITRAMLLFAIGGWPMPGGQDHLVRQALALLLASPMGSSMAQHSVSADGPGLQGRA